MFDLDLALEWLHTYDYPKEYNIQELNRGT